MQRALNTYIHKAHAQHWDTRLGDACCLLTLFSVDFDYKVENNTWAHFSVCLRVRVCIKYIYTTHFVWVPWKIQNTFWFEYQFASCVFEQERIWWNASIFIKLKCNTDKILSLCKHKRLKHHPALSLYFSLFKSSRCMRIAIPLILQCKAFCSFDEVKLFSAFHLKFNQGKSIDMIPLVCVHCINSCYPAFSTGLFSNN